MLVFSIIIPTYNRQDFIAEAIQSALSQTYAHIEIIVVDDGSTDDTRVVVKRIEDLDNRVKFYQQNQGERGIARNTGIKKATGNYLVFLDSDDLMLPNYIQDLATAIQQDPSIKFAALHYKKSSSSGKLTDGNYFLTTNKYNLDTFLEGNHLACNFCIVNDAVQPILFLEDRKYTTAEDWVFVLEALQKYKWLTLIDKTGVIMRQHEGQSMVNNAKVIAARKASTVWVKENLKLNAAQLKIVEGHTAYFSAIHQFNDNEPRKSREELKTAINLLGYKTSFIVLKVKTLIGPNTIIKFKKLVGL